MAKTILFWVTKLAVANFESLSKGWGLESKNFLRTNRFYWESCVILCFVNDLM